MEARPGGGEFRSEYGGLVLGADGAFGLFGVHQPRGAPLGLRVTLLLRDVTLWTQTPAASRYYQRWLSLTIPSVQPIQSDVSKRLRVVLTTAARGRV